MDNASGGGSGRLIIGRPFGVPVDVTPSWFVVAALITWGFAATVEEAVPGLGAWRYGVSLTFALLLYASVFLHELSHTVVALRAGLTVRRISLHLLGGVSEIAEPAPTPGREAGIALAGPLVSLVLAGVGLAVAQIADPGSVLRLLGRALMLSNLAVGVFNLLPGLPLDGGRVVAAGVWRVTGRRHTGTVAAGWVGRVVAVLVLTLPLVVATSRGRHERLIDIVMAALVASFIWIGAGKALEHARLQERLPQLSLRTLTRRAIPVAVDMPLAEAMRRLESAGAHALVVVDAGGTPIGLVSERAVTDTPGPRRAWVSVGDLSTRLEPGLRLAAELQGQVLVDAMGSRPAGEYLVVERNGDVYGVLATADVERALRAPRLPVRA